MITLEVNGLPYSNFTDASVSRSLESLCGIFSFAATSNGLVSFPFKVGDTCRVFVDGNLVLTGRVDSTESNYSSDGHTIAIHGRDFAADVVDSTIDRNVEINTPISLKAAIESILKQFGHSLKVIDNVGSLENFTADDKISASIGMQLFELLDDYCRKRQVLLNTDKDSNIVLTRGGFGKTLYFIRNKLEDSNANNILSAKCRIDHSQRFRSYTVRSQLNVSSLNFAGFTDAGAVGDASGKSTDPNIRATRVFGVVSEKSSNSKTCEKRAAWQANINNARSLIYSATVNGHTDQTTGKIWQVNCPVHVDDDYAGAHGRFIISSVTFSMSGEGSTTELEIVDKNAYLPEPVDKKTKQVNLLEGHSK